MGVIEAGGGSGPAAYRGDVVADSREEKVKISAKTTFNELGAKMLLAATRVVDDAEELMAMFPGLEGRRVSTGQGVLAAR